MQTVISNILPTPVRRPFNILISRRNYLLLIVCTISGTDDFSLTYLISILYSNRNSINISQWIEIHIIPQHELG